MVYGTEAFLTKYDFGPYVEPKVPAVEPIENIVPEWMYKINEPVVFRGHQNEASLAGQPHVFYDGKNGKVIFQPNE